jgi:DDE superfamily endonuclease
VRRGWLRRGVKNKSTMAKRPDRINIIGGISNYGDLFYTINHGLTNHETFLLFLMKICDHLHSIDKAWRDNTIILLDNAAYHRGNSIMKELELLKIPVMYLGPYHFKMAPIEVLFSFIKSHDLNPYNSHIHSR